MSDFDGLQAETSAFLVEIVEGAGTSFLRHADGVTYSAFLRELREDEIVSLELQGVENARDLHPRLLDYVPIDCPIAQGDFVFIPPAEASANRNHVLDVRSRPLAGAILCRRAIVVVSP